VTTGGGSVWSTSLLRTRPSAGARRARSSARRDRRSRSRRSRRTWVPTDPPCPVPCRAPCSDGRRRTRDGARGDVRVGVPLVVLVLAAGVGGTRLDEQNALRHVDSSVVGTGALRHWLGPGRTAPPFARQGLPVTEHVVAPVLQRRARSGQRTNRPSPVPPGRAAERSFPSLSPQGGSTSRAFGSSWASCSTSRA
jgi:hypothetical protein